MSEHKTPCPHCDGWTDDHVFDCPNLVAVPASPPATGKCDYGCTPPCHNSMHACGACGAVEGHNPGCPVPASPRADPDRDCICAGRGREGHRSTCPCYVAPVASGTPKEEWWDKATQLLHDEFPLLWEAQRKNGGYNLWEDFFKRVQQKCFPRVSPTPAAPLTNPSTLAGNVNNPGDLDWEAARKTLLGAEWDFPTRVKNHLNAQVRALIDAAREEEQGWAREKKRTAYEDGVEFGTRTTREEYAPLLALVAEWQEARKAYHHALDGDAVDRFCHAEAALAAWRNK